MDSTIKLGIFEGVEGYTTALVALMFLALTMVVFHG